jgi:hypothetical protein
MDPSEMSPDRCHRQQWQRRHHPRALATPSGRYTAQSAVNSIRLWLEKMGRERYPAAQRLMITADCGGSNGARVRLWKLELQKFAK